MNTCSSLSYLNTRSDEVSPRSEIALTGPVETLLEKIYGKHKHRPINLETRRKLSLISEELALEALSKVFNATYVKSTVDVLIKYFVKDAATVDGSPRPSPDESPVQSPRTPGKKSCRAFQEVSLDLEIPSPKLLRREETGGSNHIPPLVALGELEFKKMFLLLSYLGGKPLEVISGDDIRQWKDLPMVSYEAEVWFQLGERYCSKKERRRSLEGDSEKTHYYQCHVATDGSYKFKGHLLENTGTHLHKVLGDDNVLTVKFDDMSCTETNCNNLYSTYEGIAKNGIMVGLRRYQFFVFKDGGKEGKKKDFSRQGVKCYFIRTGSTALSDMENPYILDGMSIHEARMHFMHVYNLPSPANYMARFSLILSKTKKLEMDMTGITFEKIDDIHCHDQDNHDVLDKNGKPCIHSDGTGYISEDLARMCPINIFKGKSIRSNNIKGTCGEDPPLLIQFRMFYKGYAVKGTFLSNKKLPPQTVQVRPSMIKVYEDQALLNFSTFNSLEVVNTSNPPKMTRLSRNLIALLSYGGVPNDFFLNILRKTLEESKTIFYSERAAIKAAINYGDMDDQNTAEMILVDIPLDEPHLKDRLSILLKTEKNALKEGRLPIGESYYLMGTVDPTGELKENEVCVILETGQISGNVLVYRNPGLHFGDIHVLKATYVKALEDYVGNSKYAVFFPQKGPRSLGDEIAGGDFDGDMYFISRNPQLLEHFKPSEPWVSSSKPSKVYSGRKPSELSHEELEEELFKLFLDARFCKRDVIGMAADSWLAIMDRFLSLGDESAKKKHKSNKNLLKLIDIYYDALDAPKKGAKVDLPPGLQVGTFPHYMEHKKKKFTSTSILGLIFDTVESQNAEIPPPSKISKLACLEDEPVPKSYMEKCRPWYEDYKADMSQAMKETDENKKNQLTNEVIQRYKQDFYGAAGFEDSKISLEELYPKSLALHNIAYDYAIEKNDVRCCGFVWRVAGPVLCKFYAKKTQDRSLVASASVLKRLFG
ncbi:probable RNA-dependent RNA polymerase 3 isoform X1 [Capsella rubella]|uniref:probable RNA-dependent RNA polymerase 3 isoform X1 n=1 Tax=Capsella rubella TaxID=81985 RepID=UPI000CD4E467|nr:probable RNA-dependent RNA polymerase 3 isoform X1 [Capsella rubella]